MEAEVNSIVLHMFMIQPTHGTKVALVLFIIVAYDGAEIFLAADGVSVSLSLPQ